MILRLLRTFCLTALTGTLLGNASAAELVFERDVRPILKAACFHCHGEDGIREGGLDIRLVRLMKAGGESGAAIEPGQPGQSLLWKRIVADEMPEGEKKLSADEKEIIKEWIAQGAVTARPEPANAEDARFTHEELAHWAFQPIAIPKIPNAAGNSAIDAFVQTRLASENLKPSPRAPRGTLIRRLSYDLTGLPPSPHAVDAFVNDPSPNADGRLVDRLLASPQFGVRWGRHWLDVAGYAETNGGPGKETKREGAWRYRNYVIDALNADLPVDQFIHEQLAGDELAQDRSGEERARLLTATGFLRMAPDGTQVENTLEMRNNAVADAMTVVGTSLLGLTVGCAQCHDHKYDPIGSDDYYRFRAIFDPAFPLQNWKPPNQRLVDLTSAEVQEEWDRIEAEAKALEDDLNRRRRERGTEIQAVKLADVPERDRSATKEAVLTEPSKRNEAQNALLDRYPMVKPVSAIVGLLVEYDGPAYRAFQKEAEAIAELRQTKPLRRQLMVTTEPEGPVPVSHIFFRGNPQAPKEAVDPMELFVLRRHHGVTLPNNDPSHSTTGRRLAYARHLTTGKHPLTARVFVNRLWQHHFGQGLVATPNDFGLAGDLPSHPGLLDWLATELVQHQWSQKPLHRLLVLSQTYQQESTRDPEQDSIDPENRLLARANLRRLSSEEIRDTLLMASEQLSLHLGGPSLPVTESQEGKAVLGVQKIRDGLRAGADNSRTGAARRSVFVEVHRTLPLNSLATFDPADLLPNCGQRRSTTVATQALWFLNDEVSLAHAERIAQRLLETKSSSNKRLSALFKKLFGHLPTETERERCLTYVAEQSAHFTETQPEKAEQLSWASLCQVLLASNRLLYVD